MINQIVLQNFQSHKKTTLNLDPHVNAIIGDSNSGKTAILRGLYWTIYNRPSGQSFVSFWNRDDKGNPIKSSYVKVSNDSYVIKRIRSDLNGYKITIGDSEEKAFEAIGMDVPELVADAFNLGEVNIQKQMDQPFMLSESASEVARFLNREIRLDIIDRVLSEAEARRKRLNASVKQTELQIASIENDLTKYEFLDEAEKLSKQLDKEIEAENVLLDDIARLTEFNDDYINNTRTMNHYAKIQFEEIEQLLAEYKELVKVEEYLELGIEQLEEYKLDHREKENNIITYSMDIEKLEKQMPKVCPLCGSEM